MCRRAIHANLGQNARREIVGTPHSQHRFGELDDRGLEVGGVVCRAGLLGPGVESGDQVRGGSAARGGGAHDPEVVVPPRTGCGREHRRGDRRQRAEGLRRQCLRSEDQVRSARGDGGQIRCAATAYPGQVVHHGAQIRRLGSRTVRQCGRHDARLQAQRAQGVELVIAECDDALRVGHDGGLPGRMTHRFWRRRVEPGGFGRAGVVGPALVAQDPGRGDLGGAGHDAVPRSGRRCVCRGGTPAGRCHRHQRGESGKAGAEGHDATVTPGHPYCC